MKRTTRYVSLTTVAECFEVEVHWVEQVYEFGLIDVVKQERDEPAIAAEQLQRVADVLRLFRQGVNLEGIALIMRVEEP